MTASLSRDGVEVKVQRRVAALLAALLAGSLAACAPALPESVVPGTKITVGWTGEFTSTNAAASPTAGNIDIAETIRGDFGDVVDGEFVPDESFGTVTIIADDPFTVRYDLAEPSWSDGTPLDAADLLLGWAGAAGYFTQAGEAAKADSRAERSVPRVEEFERAIEVTFPQPDIGWQQAVAVPVPAHVVGHRAFGTKDVMEAKQAVITAIQTKDSAALEKIAAVWNEGFELGAQSESPADQLISSGPFLVAEVGSADGGQSVTLVPNPSYGGLATAKVARVDLVPPGDSPLTAVGDTLDIVQVSPVAANRGPVRDLERQDFTVTTTHDGTIWAMLLKPSGIFSGHPARSAFIRAVSASTMVQGGAGEWMASYSGTTSMVSAPGSRANEIVNEDSGFTTKLGTPADDAALDREHAGVPAGSRVCVLYDRRSEFAVGAFAALRVLAGEAGWNAADCGSDDFDSALAKRGWDAVITQVPIPQTPEQIAAQWGSGGEASVTGHVDPDRDALIAQLAQTPDVYEAREVRAQIEASIVDAAVALPIAANPRLTITDRGVTGITPRNGAVSPLMYGATQWTVVP